MTWGTQIHGCIWSAFAGGEGLREHRNCFIYAVWKLNVIIAMIDMRDVSSAGRVKCFIRVMEVVRKYINFWYSTFCTAPSMYSFKNVSRWLQLSNKGEIASLWVKYSKWRYTQNCQMWEIEKQGVKKKEKIIDFSEQILSSNFLGRVRL